MTGHSLVNSDVAMSEPSLTFNPSIAPASFGMAALLLLRVIRPIRWSPSLDGCQVTGCCNRGQHADAHRDTQEIHKSISKVYPLLAKEPKIRYY